MKKKLFALVLISLFVNSIFAQTVETVVETNNTYEKSSISNNGNFIVISYTIDGTLNDVTKLYSKESDGTWSFVHEYPLLADAGSSESVETLANVLSDSGESYSFFRFDETSTIRIQKNALDGTNSLVIDIVDFTNFEQARLINNSLYIANNEILKKINPSTNQIEWSSSTLSAIGVKDEIFLTPDNNIGVGSNDYFLDFRYTLLKFNSTTGTSMSQSTIINSNISEKAFVKHIDNYELAFYRPWGNYSGGETMSLKDLDTDVFYQTDWRTMDSDPYFPDHNCWNIGVDEVNIIDDRVIALSFNNNDEYVFFFDKQMVHGYIKKIVENTDYGISKNKKVNDDGTYTFINVKDGDTRILSVNIPEEDMSLLPSLNVVTDDHIVAVYDSQKYVNGQFVPTYHESTIVFENGYLPIVDYSDPSYPESSWLTANSATSSYSVYPFTGSDNEGIVFRKVYVSDADNSHKINIKVHCVEESTVSSVADYKNEDVLLYPNPTKNTVTIKTEQNIVSIQIYNEMMQLLIENTNMHTIDLSKLNQGFYLIKIETENGYTISKKILKE